MQRKIELVSFCTFCGLLFFFLVPTCASNTSLYWMGWTCWDTLRNSFSLWLPCNVLFLSSPPYPLTARLIFCHNQSNSNLIFQFKVLPFFTSDLLKMKSSHGKLYVICSFPFPRSFLTHLPNAYCWLLQARIRERWDNRKRDFSCYLTGAEDLWTPGIPYGKGYDC